MNTCRSRRQPTMFVIAYFSKVRSQSRMLDCFPHQRRSFALQSTLPQLDYTKFSKQYHLARKKTPANQSSSKSSTAIHLGQRLNCHAWPHKSALRGPTAPLATSWDSKKRKVRSWNRMISDQVQMSAVHFVGVY